jgi:hypothetical protein
MKSTLIVVAITSFLAGCSAQTFNINGDTAEIATNQQSQHFFVSGIGQEKSTNAAQICNGAANIIKVESQQTFINGLLGAVTFGIYTPRDSKVYCKTNQL